MPKSLRFRDVGSNSPLNLGAFIAEKVSWYPTDRIYVSRHFLRILYESMEVGCVVFGAVLKFGMFCRICRELLLFGIRQEVE
jgi:hypothetical protein